MNFKLNALVAAALLASGSAHAITAADSPNDGNAYLLLTVLDANYNGGVGRSYTRSLEVAMNDFGTVNRPTGGFTTNVDGLNQTWATGALWSQFTAGMDASTIAGLQWDVTAADAFGGSAADLKRILTTSTTNLEEQIANSVGSANSEVNNAVLNQDYYWDAVIAAMGTGTEIMVDDPASNAFAISVAVHGTDLGGQIKKFSTMGNVGDSMGFYYLTRSSTSNTAEALAVAYGVNGVPTTFTLGVDGSLAVAAVPEASTYGMMLAGLGLVGFMARRRINGRA